MRGHYALLTLSAYLVACLLVWSAPTELTTAYRAICLALALAGGWGFGRWFYTFKPAESQEESQ